MKRVMQLLVVALPVFSLTLILLAARTQAQQAAAPAPAPAKGCNPCISRNFDNWTAADEQRVTAQGMRYCKAHPEKCDNTPDQHWPVQLKTVDGRNWTRSHYNECFPDHYNPKNPTGIICIPDTWVANGGEPQPGQCYTDAKDPTNRRCVPSHEELLRATQDGW